MPCEVFKRRVGDLDDAPLTHAWRLKVAAARRTLASISCCSIPSEWGLSSPNKVTIAVSTARCESSLYTRPPLLLLLLGLLTAATTASGAAEEEGREAGARAAAAAIPPPLRLSSERRPCSGGGPKRKTAACCYHSVVAAADVVPQKMKHAQHHQLLRLRLPRAAAGANGARPRAPPPSPRRYLTK